MDFSEKIKKIREKINKSQEELAKLLGVSFATVNRWENGHIIPKKKMLDKIKEFCGDNNISFDNDDNKSLSGGFKLISTSLLQDWFKKEKRLSQGLFPEIIQKLIIESVSKIKEIHFPSGDQIVASGFDGIVNCEDYENLFVPFGKSVRELGATLEDSNSKIKKDYSKRTLQIPSEQKKDLVFMLMTPKTLSYTSLCELKSFCKKDNRKEVRIYDGVDLELWLSQCLGTSLWLYEEFEKKRLNLKTFNKAYDDLVNETVPSLSPKLFTASREEESKKFVSLLRGENASINISGPSVTDIYGFVLSSIYESNDSDLKSRLIIADDLESLKEAYAITNNKIFLLASSKLESIDFTNKNKYIFLLGNSTYNLSVDIKLANRPCSVINNVLKDDMKINEEKLADLKHAAENNISLIIRELSNRNSLKINNRLKNEALLTLIPILLVGKIDLRCESDKEILSEFLESNVTLDDYVANIYKWKKVDDSPIVIYDQIVKLNLKEEIWKAINDLIPVNKIKKLKNIIMNIFLDYDPKYDLPIDKRPFSEIHNKQWRYNDYIIEGLLNSCILLSIYSGKQDEMDSFCREILFNIKTKQQMFTVSNYFLYLAELSPSAFLDYFERKISSNDEIVMSIFESLNLTNAFSGGSEYTRLLRSLELLLKFDESKIRSSILLALLSTKNFKYKFSNTPKESLVSNLHWVNKSNALTLEDRERILTMCFEKYGSDFVDVGMDFLLANSFLLTNVVPKWKPQDIAKISVNFIWVNQFNKRIVSDILEYIEPSKIEILDSFFRLHTALNLDVLNCIKDYIFKTYNKDTDLGTKLYELLMIRRYDFLKYSDIQDKEFFNNYLNELINFLTPSDLLERNLFYFKEFEYNLPICEVIDEDPDKEKTNGKKIQEKIFSELYDCYPADVLFGKIIKTINNSRLAGEFLAKQKLTDDDLNVIMDLSIKFEKYEFLLNLLINKSPELYKNFIKQLTKPQLTQLIPIMQTFNVVPECIYDDEDLCKSFYKNRYYREEYDEKDRAFIKQYNPISYLDYMLYDTNLETQNLDEVVNILRRIRSEDIKNSSDIYTIKRTLYKLENLYNLEEVFLLEIKYSTIFDFDEIPNTIKKFFFNNPMQLIDFMVSTSNKDDNLGNIKFKFLNYMSFPVNFASEHDKINNFIKCFIGSRDMSEENKSFLYQFLGQILARSYKSNNEDFIPYDLKFILERISNNEVNVGIVIGYENMRGVRRITDGSPEFQAAEKLKEEIKRCQIDFPQAAEVLRSLVLNRKNDGKRDKEHCLKVNDLI